MTPSGGTQGTAEEKPGQCSAVQCSAVQGSAVQGSTVQCSEVQCSAEQCRAVQCNAVQGSAVQCSAVQCSVVLESVPVQRCLCQKPDQHHFVYLNSMFDTIPVELLPHILNLLPNKDIKNSAPLIYYNFATEQYLHDTVCHKRDDCFCQHLEIDEFNIITIK